MERALAGSGFSSKLVRLCGFAGLASSWLSLSCATCDRESAPGEEQYYRAGTTYADLAYESVGWQGPYLPFPPGRTYRFVHGFGVSPPLVQAYVAFSESGAEASLSAGNQTIVGPVTDEFIQVRNDTCAELFLRVVAFGTSPQNAADAGNAASLAGDASTLAD